MHKLARLGPRPTGVPLAGALLAVATLAGAAETVEPPRSSLRVSSTLERIGPAAVNAGDVAPDVAAAAVASPADELVLSLKFTNASEQVVDAVRITSPVPPGVRYAADSASGPGSEALFSADHGGTFGRPEEIFIVSADGVARVADAAEYTHVRFVLDAPLDAGATGLARFRVVPR